MFWPSFPKLQQNTTNLILSYFAAAPGNANSWNESQKGWSLSSMQKNTDILDLLQGQAGQGFEQPGLAEGAPAHGRVVGSLPTLTILWFYLIKVTPPVCSQPEINSAIT